MKHERLRYTFFFVGVLVISGLIIQRLFVLSVLRHDTYLSIAQAQNDSINNIASRGNIYLTSGSDDFSIVATNKKFPQANVIPLSIEDDDIDIATLSLKLSDILEIDQEQIRQNISSGKSGKRVLARRISDAQVDLITKLNLKSVGVTYESDRYYPASELSSNVIGFLGYNRDGVRAGQYGIEEYYEKELSNLSSDIILTIDMNVQRVIEDKLDYLIDKWDAKGGTIIIQKPDSGKIIAMVDRPSFNPNNYKDFDPELFLSDNVQKVFEPGSSFKVITMAAGLDAGIVSPQTIYKDIGYVKIGEYTIKNFNERIFGDSSMSDVLEKSINTGTMFVENKIGDEVFLDYVINMGFGQQTGIDLPSEVSGDITNLYSGRKINYLTASFGQGIAVTPLQLINSYSVIANGGRLMRPYVGDRIIDKSGNTVTTEPEVLSIPISEKTAAMLTTMLVGAVDNGFDKAGVVGYDIAGKTGTAQIPDDTGSYLEDDFIHNFVGFAPAYNPEFVILIKLDKPQGHRFASDTLSVGFKELAEFMLNYYNIPPTRK
jgi:cell division protein FtsI/penicillin-binding protein 2